jgi:hypothetical protein
VRNEGPSAVVGLDEDEPPVAALGSVRTTKRLSFEVVFLTTFSTHPKSLFPAGAGTPRFL